RDRIALEPYSGVQKGALGTLLTRGGNDLDRALLLVALLKSQSIDAKIAHGLVRPDQAQQLLNQLVDAPDALHQQIASLPRFDKATPSGATTDRSTDDLIAGRQARLQAAIDQQYAWLAARVKNASLPAAGDARPILSALQ